MLRRLYFLLPDVESARQTANDLLLARVEDRRMHFLARRGTDLGELREASALQKTDLVHSAELGMILGGIGGLLIGGFMVLTPPEGMTVPMVTVLLGVLGGCLFGAWAASLIGVSTPSKRLQQYAADIEAGAVLLMLDVPASRVEEIRELVHRRHPEASGGAMEPTMPAFP